MQCGRVECVTCNQGGEEIPDCTRASLVYESICVKCNPTATAKGELRDVKEGGPSLYVGESSRSIQERALEHWDAARRGDSDSHMRKHQDLEHPNEQPEFLFKVVSTHRTALNRQVREAVRIRRRGGAGMILNSKSEFNRCHIPRLVVEQEDEEHMKLRLEQEKRDKEELAKLMDDLDLTWEERKQREQEILSNKKRVRMSESGEGQKPKRLKKMKFKIIGEEWGENENDKEIDEPVDGSQSTGSNNTPGEQMGAGTPNTKKRKRPREQKGPQQPPQSVIANCDEPIIKKRLVNKKLMGRTIADYFKMSTGELNSVDGDCTDLWGSSGDREFFEETSDQVLAT